jgi:hypothetical protein
MNHRVPHVRKLDNGLWVLVIDDIQVNMLLTILGYERRGAPTSAINDALREAEVASSRISAMDRRNQARPNTTSGNGRYGQYGKVYTDDGWVELYEVETRYNRT